MKPSRHIHFSSRTGSGLFSTAAQSSKTLRVSSPHLSYPFAIYLVTLLALFSSLADTRVHIDPTAKAVTLSIPESRIPSAPWSIQYTTSLISPQDWRTVTPLNQRSLPEGETELTLALPDSPHAYFRLIEAPNSNRYPLVLNEIMSNNRSSHSDEDGDFSDWIELYNPNSTPVSLSSWHLSDNANNLTKWSFPEVDIPAMAYLLIYASGKNKLTEGAPFHTNFRISADGETITLTNGESVIIDQIKLGRLGNDESFGRIQSPDGSWAIYPPTSTSPGVENDPTDASPYVAEPTFITPPGLYSDGLLFELTHSTPSTTLFYTTDGSMPDSESAIYGAAFPIQTNTVIRAIARDEAGAFSRVISGSYLIGTDHNLPIVSLIAPPDNFDIRDGFLYGFGEHMYPRSGFAASFPYSASNAWKDREIAASLEFFDDKHNETLRQDIGLKVFGGWGSRGYPQKSFAIFARSKYGKGKIDFPLFPGLDIDEFESFILRNSGNDNQSTHHIPPRPPIRGFGPTQGNGSYFDNGTFTLFRDAMMQTLASNLDVDRQAYRPTVLYLNGQYWGIYNLREKLNEHYVESHHGVSSDAVDLIEGYSKANAGSNRFYREAQSYIRRIDLSSDERFETVASKYINISSFIDYHLAVIYFQNFDIGNIKQWRAQDGGTFRWMLYDQDYGFHLWPEDIYVPAMARDYGDYDNMFAFYTNPEGSGNGWPNEGGRTRFLRRLLLNDNFKTQFITRCLDLLNSSFESERVKNTIDTLAEKIRPEIPAHLARWSWNALQAQRHGIPFKPEDESLDIDLWERNVNILHDFAAARPDKLRNDLVQHFQLDASQTALSVEVQPIAGGTVQLNSLELESTPWTGTYLQEIPTRLIAKPAEGYVFEKWTGGGGSENSVEIWLDVVGEPDVSLTAHFRPSE